MLTFDEAKHEYRFNGAVVPSVTQILGMLVDWSRVPADALEYKRDLGTAVHKATELYDQDDLDESTMSPTIVPYLEAWKRFRAEKQFEIIGLEERIYHQLHGYAGTYDRLIVIDGQRAVLDIKTGDMYDTYGPQTAAYKNAVEHATGKKIFGRYVVQLRDDGTYRLEPMAGKDDWSIFLSCLTIHRFKNRSKQ